MNEIITALTLIFGASAMMLFVLDMFRHPAIPAYILAGILIGHAITPELLLDLVQLGIAFLGFIFGMRIAPSRLRAVVDDAARVTLVQVGVTLLLVVGAGLALGADLQNALYVGIAAALSSSLIGLDMLRTMPPAGLLHDRLSESINLVQDILAIFMVLAVLSAPFTLERAMENLVYGLLLMGGALVIRGVAAARIAEFAGRSRELMMLTGMSSLAVFLFLSQYLGVPVVVGSFAAGMAMAKFPYNLELLDTMSSLKDFFSAVFFTMLGALLTVPGPMTLGIAAVLVIITSLVKPALTMGLLVWEGYDWRTSFLAGMRIDHVGEFALIIAIQAFIAGAILTPVFEAIIIAAVATMILSSYTTRHAEEIYQVLADRRLIRPDYTTVAERSNVEDDLSGHVVLAGYGVQGKMIARDLEQQEQPFVVIDNDPEQIATARSNGHRYVFGNARDARSWEMADADRAHLLVSTIPDRYASRTALDLDTGADIILQATGYAEAQEFLDDGALYVDIPELMAADQLTAHLRGVIASSAYARDLRERNLEELENYFTSREDDAPGR